MHVTFSHKPAFSVVGIRIHARGMSPEISALWKRFVPRISEIPHLAEPRVSYGIMDNFDDATCELDYMAGVSVSRFDPLPSGMTVWPIAAADYAVFETTLSSMGSTMEKIYSEWLPSSGYRPAPGPSFERYGESFNPENPVSVLSIYIPVAK